MSAPEEVMDMLNKLNPDAVLNLVGMTNVDFCESYPNEAYVGNVKTLENVASWIRNAKKSVQLIHISTDQVYDGQGPHAEDKVDLKNYYAFSKYAGELVAGMAGGLIIRTNFFGKSKCENRASLTDWLFSNLTENNPIQVFEDVLFSPLSMPTLCEMLSLAIEKKLVGVYNLGARDGLSKADFAYKFALSLRLNCNIMARCSSDEVNFIKTYRPKDMRLDVQRFERAAGVTLPSLVVEIDRATKEYQK
ncbi:dTDP-4-dehydrorhamnose reductase [Vreelandella boliviensis LC1]|nr:dTDP-4-dehydrorhamnose reductase [Halomonas boliviensis LC1]